MSTTTQDDLIVQLGAVSLFSSLSKRQLKRLAQCGRIVEQADGKDVLNAGGSALGFHYVLEGTASVTAHGELKRSLSPGDYFGEMSLIDGKPRSATVTAGHGLRTFSLLSYDFQPLLADPEVTQQLLLGLCARVRESLVDEC